MIFFQFDELPLHYLNIFIFKLKKILFSTKIFDKSVIIFMILLGAIHTMI